MKYLPLFLILLGCSTPKKSCWNEERSSLILNKILSISNTWSDAINQETTAKLKLVENTCTKRKYAMEDRFIVLVNNPDGTIAGRTFRASENPVQCLNRGLASVTSLKEPSFDRLIELHIKLRANEWADPDLSPSGWLNCQGTTSEYQDSVVTMLHEFNHEVRQHEKQCLYVTARQEYICFKFSDKLPLRSYGKLDVFPTKDPKVIQGLSGVQQVYLTNTDQPFYSQLDEFNAYILTNTALARFYQTLGAKNFYDPEHKRPGVFSPLFYKITMNYLVRLKKEQPALFEQEFVKNELNIKSLRVLLDEMKGQYHGWVNVLKKNKDKEKDWEKALFKEALALEKSLGGN